MKLNAKYGILIGSLMSAVSFLSHFLEEKNFLHYMITPTLLVILATGLAFGAIQARKVRYQDSINFAQVLYTGMAISAIAGIVFGLFSWLYFGIINPGLVEKLNAMEAQYIAEMTEPDKPEFVAKTLASHVASAFIAPFFYGTVFSVLIAAFVRNKDTFTAIKEEKK